MKLKGIQSMTEVLSATQPGLLRRQVDSQEPVNGEFVDAADGA
jgi:hypothetical protein